MSTAPSLLERANALAAADQAEAAAALLDRACRAGDAEACFALALWRLSGRPVARDLPAARELFRRSGEAGQAVYAAFLANGTGGPRDWAGVLDLLRARPDAEAARQLELIEAMDIDAQGNPARLPRSERLSASPDAVLFRSLFTPDECDFLAQTAAPRLAPATVVHPVSGAFVHDPVRRSDVAAFPLALENPAVHALNRRLAAASGTAPEQGEPLQILRYRPGQEYRPHSDALAGEPNPRIATMLVYLNTDFEGGETFFPSGNLAVRGGKGEALLFRNTIEDGSPDPASLHAGLPVTRGTKLIASRWIRARPLDLAAPGPAR